MDDARYPIGPFQSVARELTASERTALIDAIAAHPMNMRAAVAGLDDDQLDTPYRDGGWTVRQVVHHVVDSHLNSYTRFKRTRTEDDPVLVAYDEKRWAELPDAKSAPVQGSLDLLEALHARWVSFLRALTPDDFRRRARHGEWGEITMDLLLEVYGWHCPHHEGHITALRDRSGW